MIETALRCEECGVEEPRKLVSLGRQGDVAIRGVVARRAPGTREPLGDLCKSCWPARRAAFLEEREAAKRARLAAMNPVARPPRAAATIANACVICGSRDVNYHDQLGRRRGPKPLFRQLQNIIPGFNFITGARCGECDRGIQRNLDWSPPAVAWVREALGRGPEDPVTAADFWCFHVVEARRRGDPDPVPPAEPWEHTTMGPGTDAEEMSLAERVARLEASR